MLLWVVDVLPLKKTWINDISSKLQATRKPEMWHSWDDTEDQLGRKVALLQSCTIGFNAIEKPAAKNLLQIRVQARALLAQHLHLFSTDEVVHPHRNILSSKGQFCLVVREPALMFDRSVLREATDAGGDVALVFAVKRCCCKAKRSRKCILSASSSMSASPAVTREVGVSVGVGGSKLASSEEPGITGAGCAVKAASSSRSVEGGIAKVAV